jgi:hexosaminidase
MNSDNFRTKKVLFTSGYHFERLLSMKSKKFLYLRIKSFSLALLFIINLSSMSGQSIEIIPTPAEITFQQGYFRIPNNINVYYKEDSIQKIIELSYSKIKIPYQIVKSTKNADIEYYLRSDLPRIEKEGYVMNIEPSKITIEGNTEAGLFYATQTLIQFLSDAISITGENGATRIVSCAKIVDYPRFAWRGLMLDVSRHFFTKEQVKTYLDIMAMYKFNVFHWHLTDDQGWRIEIKSLPELTQKGAWRVKRNGPFGNRKKPLPNEQATEGGYYSQDDIKEIVNYATERHITIVPEVDIPGHSMAAIAAYPILCCTKDTSIRVDPGTNFAEWYADGTFKMLVDNTLNPSDNHVYSFLDKVFCELANLFPGKYIHVGGDECYKGYWAKDANCMALMKKLKLDNIEQLQGYFMQRVDTIIKKYGKTMIGWDEIYEGGISNDAAIMCWRNPETGWKAAANGYKVVMSPTQFAYIDYFQGDPSIEPPVYGGLRLEKCYSFEPCPNDSCTKANILGGQGNLWTENIPVLYAAMYMTYPRAWAISETFWSPKEKKNWDNFVSRIEKQFSLLDALKVNYSKALYDPIIKTSFKDSTLIIEMDTEANNLNIFYTIDGTMPCIYSSVYSTPFEIPEGCTLRAIAFRNSKPIGHLIILSYEQLKSNKYLKKN